MLHRHRAAAAALFLASSAWTSAAAQSSGTNPDISVIGEVLVCPQGAEDCSYDEADGTLELQAVELAFQGYLSPFVRGDFFAGYHDGEFEIEEAYATFVRGLGPLQARIGKYRLNWGSVNPLHPHAYSWIFQPLAEERFFGEEGLNQIAVGANASFPVGDNGEFALAFDVLRGDLVEDEHGHEDEGDEPPATGLVCVGPGCDDGVCEPDDSDCALVFYEPGEDADAEDEGPDLAYRFGASFFRQFGTSHSLRVGANALLGTLDPALDREVRWLGADFKYRWRPDKYRSLNVLGAWLHSEADLEDDIVTSSTCLGPDCAGDVCPDGGVCLTVDDTAPVKGESISTSGAYLVADWQFAQRWNGGVKLDRSEGLLEDDVVERAEAFVNFRLMEESTLFRLLVRREDGDAFDEAHLTSAIQVVFSLGPHRPHAF